MLYNVKFIFVTEIDINYDKFEADNHNRSDNNISDHLYIHVRQILKSNKYNIVDYIDETEEL